MLMQPRANITAGPQQRKSNDTVLLAILLGGTVGACLYINCVLLFTLRSKQVFCETSRYILLCNLLFADTAHLVANMVVYVVSFLQLQIPYYCCGVMVLLSVVTQSISPLTLAVMSLERYVAVCHPLRHAVTFTVKSTGMAIVVVWTFSLIHILIRVFMLVHLFTEISINLHMNFCSKEAFFFAPIFHDFERVQVIALFLSLGVVIIFSNIGVAIVATSASTNKVSARKTLKTLLLHVIQLGLILAASLFTTIITAIPRTMGRGTLLWLYNVCFLCLSILPRCLTTLIYGVRDQTLRPVLMQNLCCWWRSRSDS